MESCVALLAALLAFCAPASAAPVGQDACDKVRSSSLDLNQFARSASVKAQNLSTGLANYSSSVAWIEAADMCDPGSLKQKSLPCVEKLFGVLTSYSSDVEKISTFEGCTEITTGVKSALRTLHRDMSKCVRSLGGKHEREHHVSKEEPQQGDSWKKAALCRYTLDRLFSFSILTARVFAVGDPAHHSEGSTQRCS